MAIILTDNIINLAADELRHRFPDLDREQASEAAKAVLGSALSPISPLSPWYLGQVVLDEKVEFVYVKPKGVKPGLVATKNDDGDPESFGTIPITSADFRWYNKGGVKSFSVKLAPPERHLED